MYIGYDLSVSGLWQQQTEALFDVCVIGIDDQAVLASAEEGRKKRYLVALEA